MTAPPLEGRTLLARFVYSPLNYWGSLVLDGAMPVGLFVVAGVAASRRGADRLGGGLLVEVALSVFAGWLLWSFLEYVLHRYILHGSETLAQEGHAQHHRDERALLASPMFVIPLVQVLLVFVLAQLTGWVAAACFVGGAAAGYASFSWLHHAFHHFEPERGLLGHLRDRHEVHHRMARWNFGTTTSLWDRVFRTYRAPATVARIPRRRTG